MMRNIPRPRAAARVRPTLIAVVALLAVLGAASTVTGCSLAGGGSATGAVSSETSPTSVTSGFPVTVTDDASRSVTIESQPARIVSLAPANTEIVTAIGVPLARLVGVTTFDDYPLAVKRLPKMGDFTSPNLEAITAAKPDLILITGGVQADVLAKLESAGAKVVVVDPKSLRGVYSAVAMVGKATGESAGAVGVISDMKAKVAEIEARIPEHAVTPPPTAFMEVGYNPIYTAGPGTLVNDLITAAGGRNVVRQSGYVPYSAEQLLKDDPAVYLAMKGTESDPGVIESRPGYSKLSAVRDHRVAILDDNLVSRPGPRIVLGIEAIARALYPDSFK